MVKGKTSVYPPVRVDDSVVENFFGTQVRDPYRWLEDPSSEETKAFVNAQNSVTSSFLETCHVKKKLNERLVKVIDYPKYTCPERHGNYYFYSYNTGIQNQSVLYVQDSLNGEPRVLLDPNVLSDNGTVAISVLSVSHDGTILAYGLSSAGSDWVTIKFRRVENGKDLDDVLEHCKFTSITWMHDNSGIFYGRYPAACEKSDGTETDRNVNQMLCFHTLGFKQTKDFVCVRFPAQPEWISSGTVSDCGEYLIISVVRGCEQKNKLFFYKFHQHSDAKITDDLPYEKLVDSFEAEYSYVTNVGSVFTFLTNLNAPHSMLINVDIAADEVVWSPLLKEHEKDVLEQSLCVNRNVLVLKYLHDVKSLLYLADLKTGTISKQIDLDVGSISSVSGSYDYPEIFYTFVSFTSPPKIYRYDLSEEDPLPVIYRNVSLKDYDPSQFETIQVFYKSKDGSSIPMFIVRRKGLPLDSSAPALLYGYGGFNISMTPVFISSKLLFLTQFGGILAFPNLRGGGEYGEEWHQAGVMQRKQNVFDDFHAAAEYLIDQKFTSSERLVIEGGSNGGLLVGACANQRPHLYAAVVCHVGVMDMLRFQKFTIGAAWVTEFGCAENSEEEFNYIFKYSPLHNIPLSLPVGTQYPCTLLLTADHDDRVVPLHMYKFAAQLQSSLGSQSNPLLLLVDTDSGHSAGKPMSKRITELTDIYSFLFNVLNLKFID